MDQMDPMDPVQKNRIQSLATVFIEHYFQIVKSSVDRYNNISREQFRIVFRKHILNVEQDIYNMFYTMSFEKNNHIL